MRDELDLGSAPSNESTVQVGSSNYMERAEAESRRYIKLLEQKFPDPPSGTRFKLKYNPHDFGTYISVVVEFNDAIPESYMYAITAEHFTPRTWKDNTPPQRKKYRVTVEEEDSSKERELTIVAASERLAEIAATRVLKIGPWNEDDYIIFAEEI